MLLTVNVAIVILVTALRVIIAVAMMSCRIVERCFACVRIAAALHRSKCSGNLALKSMNINVAAAVSTAIYDSF